MWLAPPFFICIIISDMNDTKFTERIQAWFSAEHTDDNIREGAMLLLQLNNNRHLYQQIILRPQTMLEHLKYELQKHLGYRLKGMTLDEVSHFDHLVTPVLQAAVDKAEEADQADAAAAPHLLLAEVDDIDAVTPAALIARGKRADHDQLPDDIKEIWESNAALWKQIKQLFASCQAYTLSCDRFEGLNAANDGFKKMLLSLKTMYYAYKQNMDTYDHAKPGESEGGATEAQRPVVTANQVGNARSYITKNLDKLIQLMADGNTDKAAELRAKVQQRVDILLSAEAEITPDTIAKLQQAGIEMPGQQPSDEPAAEESSSESAEQAGEVADEGSADQPGPEAAPAE